MAEAGKRRLVLSIYLLVVFIQLSQEQGKRFMIGPEPITVSTLLDDE